MDKESDFSEPRGEHPGQDLGERETKGLGGWGPRSAGSWGEGTDPVERVLWGAASERSWERALSVWGTRVCRERC